MATLRGDEASASAGGCRQQMGAAQRSTPDRAHALVLNALIRVQLPGRQVVRLKVVVGHRAAQVDVSRVDIVVLHDAASGRTKATREADKASAHAALCASAAACTLVGDAA